jgi:hypothetical protein
MIIPRRWLVVLPKVLETLLRVGVNFVLEVAPHAAKLRVLRRKIVDPNIVGLMQFALYGPTGFVGPRVETALVGFGGYVRLLQSQSAPGAVKN